MSGREVKLPSNSKLDIGLAEALGLKIKKGKYKGLYSSLDGVNPTLFTQAPMFTTNPNLKDYMIKKGKKHGIEIIETDLESIAQQLLDGLKGKGSFVEVDKAEKVNNSELEEALRNVMNEYDQTFKGLREK